MSAFAPFLSGERPEDRECKDHEADAGQEQCDTDHEAEDVQYILGPDYADLRGNNERLFPLALVLSASGWAVALAAWRSLDAERITHSRRRDLLIGRVVLPVLGFLAFRYVPALADAMSSTPEDKGYRAGLPSSGRSRRSISASSCR